MKVEQHNRRSLVLWMEVSHSQMIVEITLYIQVATESSLFENTFVLIPAFDVLLSSSGTAERIDGLFIVCKP